MYIIVYNILEEKHILYHSKIRKLVMVSLVAGPKVQIAITFKCPFNAYGYNRYILVVHLNFTNNITQFLRIISH